MLVKERRKLIRGVEVARVKPVILNAFACYTTSKLEHRVCNSMR